MIMKPKTSSRWSRCLKPPSHIPCLFSLLFIPLCASTYVYCSRALTLEGGIWLLCLSPLHIHPPTDRPTDRPLFSFYLLLLEREERRLPTFEKGRPAPSVSPSASLFAAQPRLKDGEYSLAPPSSLFLMVSAANAAARGVLFSSATHYVRIAAASIPTPRQKLIPHAQTILMRSSALMIFPNVLLVQRPFAFAQRGLLCCAMRRHSTAASSTMY